MIPKSERKGSLWYRRYREEEDVIKREIEERERRVQIELMRLQQVAEIVKASRQSKAHRA
jgi:hypothetical protein